jgi:spermidine synthase
MVDIDAEVIALCRQYLPNHSRGAFDDPRTELYHTDARKYLANTEDWYDVIIIDLPDPIEEGPAYLLYTREFYQLVRQRLTDDGLIAIQAGSASLKELLNLTAVYHTLRGVFDIVAVNIVDMPCFGGPWGFCIASREYDPLKLTIDDIDSRIRERGLAPLRFYDGQTHRGMFSLPLYIRNALAAQQKTITDAEPLYLYIG